MINNKEIKEIFEFALQNHNKNNLKVAEEFYKRKDLISKTTSNIQIRKAINKDTNRKYLPYKKFLSKYGDKYNWYN